MKNSTKVMLDKTMKLLDYIMSSIGPERAMEMEAYNLIDAAAFALRMDTEEMDLYEKYAHWKELQGWAEKMYSKILKVPCGKSPKEQFHVAGKLMRILVICKKEKEMMMESIKDMDGEEVEETATPCPANIQ